ncbi:hypothetical protein TNCV_451291 [Trichonephila clavipes]|nr:hypothetical protein TNCV_451291 [Trichonephila clavipes]
MNDLRGISLFPTETGGLDKGESGHSQEGASHGDKGNPNSNSEAKQPMRARSYYIHPSIRGHWMLRFMSRSLDQEVSLKRDPLCLSLQASLVLI